MKILQSERNGKKPLSSPNITYMKQPKSISPTDLPENPEKEKRVKTVGNTIVYTRAAKEELENSRKKFFRKIIK